MYPEISVISKVSILLFKFDRSVWIGSSEQLEKKYKELSDQNEILSKRLDEFRSKEKIEERKQIEFSEKIDELNQETDTLLEEIDKWQM